MLIECTWASNPDETRTYSLVEKQRPVTLLLWPLRIQQTYRNIQWINLNMPFHIMKLRGVHVLVLNPATSAGIFKKREVYM